MKSTSPHRPFPRPLGVALLLSAMILGGCGGSNDNGTTSQPSDEKTPQMRCAPAPASASSQSCTS